MQVQKLKLFKKLQQTIARAQCFELVCQIYNFFPIRFFPALVDFSFDSPCLALFTRHDKFFTINKQLSFELLSE